MRGQFGGVVATGRVLQVACLADSRKPVVVTWALVSSSVDRRHANRALTEYFSMSLLVRPNRARGFARPTSC